MLNDRLAKHYGIPGVEGVAIPQGAAPSRSTSRRRADDGQRAEGDGQRHDDLARRARRLGAGPHPRHAAAAAAGERAGRRARHPRRDDDPRATRQAPRDAESCAVCHTQDRSAGLRPGELRRASAAARERLSRSRREGNGPSNLPPDIARIASNGYGTGAVDAGDVLADGRKFADIDEFKQLLLAEPDRFARGLTKKLSPTPPATAWNTATQRSRAHRGDGRERLRLATLVQKWRRANCSEQVRRVPSPCEESGRGEGYAGIQRSIEEE